MARNPDKQSGPRCIEVPFFVALGNEETYAELVAVPDSDVTHLPDGVDLVDAAAVPLIALTGDQLVRHAANRAVQFSEL